MTLSNKLIELLGAIGNDIKNIYTQLTNLVNGKVYYKPIEKLDITQITRSIAINYSPELIRVYRNGLLLRGDGDDYIATDGQTIEFTFDLSVGDELDIERISVDNADPGSLQLALDDKADKAEVIKANTNEAIAGINNTKVMTPLRVKEAVDAIIRTGKIVHTGNTPPVDPIDNMLWYDTDEGYLAVFLNNGITSQWVTILGGGGSSTTAWADITDKPTAFAPSPHDHTWDSVQNKPASFPPDGHTQDWSTIENTPVTYPPSTHEHSDLLEADFSDFTDKTIDGTETLVFSTRLKATVQTVLNWILAKANTWTGIQKFRTVIFESQYANGNSGTARAINWSLSQKQSLVLNGNCTITQSFPGIGNYQLLLKQDATGNRSVTWSGVSLYIGGITQSAVNTAANSYSIASIYYDGTNIFLGVSKVNA